MLYLILIALAGALAWLARRHWQLRRALTLLADAVSQRRSFLHEDGTLPRLHPGWRRLVAECGNLLQQVAALDATRQGQLSQLQTTLGSLREGVLLIDRDNYILLANPAVRRIFPRDEEVTGRRLEVVLHSGELLELLDTIRASGESAQREIGFREQGRSIWVEATGALVAEGSGENTPWCLFVLHDISRLKELEVVRKEFVANVSHELKTPIAMLKGYADTLGDDGDSMTPEERAQFLRTIRRHAERLAAIVDDLLTLSRLESGGMVLRPVWQKAGPVLIAAFEEFREAFAHGGQTLTLAGMPETAEVRIDALRIGQVLTNLLQNARKYTPRGAHVEIGARAVDDHRGLEFWVTDDGPGIPAADLPRIFERFYRVDKGRARDTGGTGLGLSIVKHMVQLHGGAVSAESKMGEGTTIRFRLPARPAPAVPSSQVAGQAVRPGDPQLLS